MIYEELCQRLARDIYDRSYGAPWNNTSAGLKQSWCNHARLILECIEQQGLAIVPREATEEMLAATCDKQGQPRILEFTTPEERSKPFLMARYIYRAAIAAGEIKPEEGE